MNNNDFIQDSFTGNTLTKTVTVFTNLAASPLNTVMRGGVYADTVTVKLYRESGTYIFASSFSLNLSTVVPRQVEISLVDTGGSFNSNDTFQMLDFQELEANESKSFDLKVYSNAGYSLAFSSANNGKLKNGSSVIDYTLTVNGITKDLSSSSTSPVEVAQGAGITPAGGVNQAVQVTIGSVTNKLAGIYNDYITVVATAIE